MIFRGMVSMFDPGRWFPAADIYETPSALIVCVDVSGMDPQSLTVVAEEARLSISGERGFRPQEMVSGIHRLEIESGFFERTISLPRSVDASRAVSECKNGFLLITLPLRRTAGKILISVG